MAKFIEVKEDLFEHCKYLINIEQIESVQEKNNGEHAEIVLVNYGDDPYRKEIFTKETYNEIIAKIAECSK